MVFRDAYSHFDPAFSSLRSAAKDDGDGEGFTAPSFAANLEKPTCTCAEYWPLPSPLGGLLALPHFSGAARGRSVGYSIAMSVRL